MKPKVLVIAGPTGSGKKKVAFMAAELFDGEIISADSRKVYRYLDIGTAKPSRGIREQIPHHLIDIIDPDEPFSAGDWVLRAADAVSGVLSSGRLPIISGGTGFYIKAFMDGLTEGITADPEVRESLKKELSDKGSAHMYKKLKKLDPERASELNENDSFRIMRALEIVVTTGTTFSSLRGEEKIIGGDYDYYIIGLEKQREELYKSINNRVDHMVSDGLFDELKAVLNRGYSRNLTALNTVGYKEWFPFLDGDMPYETCVDLVKRDTRRYAKRQMTWFRAQKNIQWANPDVPGSVETQFEVIDRWLSSL